MSWEEEQRVRRLIPERADFHLENWGRWRRRYRHGQGHRHSSSVVCAGGVSSTFDDLCDECDAQAARVADGVIDGLDIRHRIAISHVYEAAVWRFRIGIEAALVTAAAEFWKQATRKWLV